MGGDRSQNAKAHVIMSRNDAGQWVMRIKGNAMIGKDASPTPFDVVWDHAVTWVDDQAKTAHTLPLLACQGPPATSCRSSTACVPNITGDRPRRRASQSTIVLNGTDDVGGVTCDVVIAGSTTEGNGNRKKIWIAKSDFAPASSRTSRESKLINASTVIEFSDVKVNHRPFPERDHRDMTPEGWPPWTRLSPLSPRPSSFDHLAVPEFEPLSTSKAPRSASPPLRRRRRHSVLGHLVQPPPAAIRSSRPLAESQTRAQVLHRLRS